MAHPYTTDSKEREIVPLYIAVAAIASAIGLNRLFTFVQWFPPAWIDAPSTVAFYGIYYQVFRKWLWKLSALRKIGWIKIPDLAGVWQGHVVTSYDEQSGKHPVEITIQQDWTHLLIKLMTQYSKSKSLIGGILTEDEKSISYEFLNEPLTGATETMHVHRGTARLILSSDGNSLDGEYYSGRDRTNYGAIHLKRRA